MNTKEAFFNFLDDRKEDVLAQVSALISDDRKDESNVYKAKANIYDIAKAIYGASEKQAPSENLKEDFLKRFDKITSPWAENLERAKAHGDSLKEMIDEAKLEAVSEIKEYVEKSF